MSSPEPCFTLAFSTIWYCLHLTNPSCFGCSVPALHLWAFVSWKVLYNLMLYFYPLVSFSPISVQNLTLPAAS